MQAWLLCKPDQWSGQIICQWGVWWAAFSYRCSTRGFKCLSPTTLVERQKKTIKNSLFTVLQENPLRWPSIIEEVVFANRVSKHSFTKEFPFQVTTQSRTSITSRCKNISFHLRNIRFLTSLLKRASLAICCPLLEAVINIQNQKIFTSTMRYY